MAMNPNVAKWDDLKLFLEVARHGSVHAAAVESAPRPPEEVRR